MKSVFHEIQKLRNELQYSFVTGSPQFTFTHLINFIY